MAVLEKPMSELKNTETIRAINHLYPLEIRVEESVDFYKRNKGQVDFDGGFSPSEMINIRKRLETWR